MEEVKREELELLEAQSAPLRNYLMKHVLPTVNQALIECLKVRPDDAVDFLVSRLNSKTRNMQASDFHNEGPTFFKYIFVMKHARQASMTYDIHNTAQHQDHVFPNLNVAAFLIWQMNLPPPKCLRFV